MLSRLGRFQIIRRIGQGSMGEVFLAEDPLMGRQVALKIIRPAAVDEAEARARFEREARAAARLNHPGVVTVHEFGEEAGQLYLVMEYIQGEDLNGLLGRGGLGRWELLEVLAQVCDALEEAHARGIIHRDVKPSNIRVLREGGRLQVKVMDFGVAQMSNSELTTDGIWMGTLSYMAPEYLDTGRARTASDLFAVGVILYEGFSRGRKPFPGDTPSMVLNRILLHPPDPLDPKDLEGMSPLLRPLLTRALAKRPEERFASAEEMAAALRAAGDPDWNSDGLPRVDPEPAMDEDFVAEGEATVRLDSRSFRREGFSPRMPRTAEILVVSRTGQGDCLSLGVAIRRAAPGTRILVKPGTYRESLVVDKAVEIMAGGEPSEVVLEGLEGPCLTLKADGIRVSGFRLSALGISKERSFPALDAVAGKASVEDCLVSSDGPAGICVRGEGTLLRLDRCRIQNCTGAAVMVFGQGEVMLDRCQLSGLGGPGVWAEKGGVPVLHHCTIHHAQGGILVMDEARGHFEQCNIYRNARFGVRVAGYTRAHFRQCRIHDGEDFGVSCIERAQASFEDCDIFGNASSNVQITQGSSPHFRQCRIHDGQEYGILATEEGLGTFESCDIHGHKLSALVIALGANPLLRSCRIHGNQGTGVNVNEQGLGVLEDCEIRDNLQAGLKVGRGGNPVLRRCRLVNGRGDGARFLARASGTLEDCEVKDNAKGGIRLARDANPSIRGGQLSDGIQREGGMLGRLGL